MSVISFFKTQFSVESISQKLKLLGVRFPISILLLLAITFQLFSLVGKWDISYSESYRIYTFLIVGAVISVIATLLLEDLVGNIKRHAVTAAAVALWGVYCCFLPEDADDMVIGKWLEVIAIGISALLAVPFISFLKRDKDRPFWNFTAQTIFQYALASCFGMILAVGFTLALFAVYSLFQVNINDKMYAYLSIICSVLFTSLYFLAHLPSKTAKHSEEVLPNKTLKILGLYILTPLAAVYILILYAYLFKIIFAWELPRGMVSWLVSTLASCGLITIMLLYPSRLLEKSKAIDLISRYFSLIIAPLLVLMSIGIFRRIDDYGITITRGYLLLVNIWFYAIFAHIYITKAARIKWIPISLAAIILLSSAGLQGVPNTVKHILLSEISGMIPDKKEISPADEGFFTGMKDADKETLLEKIRYVQKTFGDESLKQLFAADSSHDTYASIAALKRWLRQEQKPASGDCGSCGDGDDGGDCGGCQQENAKKKGGSSGKDRFWWSSYSNNNKIRRMSAFNTFAIINCDPDAGKRSDEIVCTARQNTLAIKVIPGNREFTVELPKVDPPDESPAGGGISRDKPLIIEGNGYGVWVTAYRGYYYYDADTVRIDDFNGYLFYNR
ncbi:MAG: DUF4153 domain-containing protein [Chitinispirillia bacterium]|nr:DUF4153 domain-containing protein [Chitinispirillia bacterium]